MSQQEPPRPASPAAIAAVFIGVFLLLAVPSGWLLLRPRATALPEGARIELRPVEGRPATLPVLAQLPAFSLVDQDGSPFGSAQMQGAVWVVDFVFTRCPSICPRMTAQMKRLQDESAKHGSALRLLSVSVDPAHDTPEAMKRYLGKYGADEARWRFLTGPLGDIEKTVTEGFKVGIDRGDGGADDFMSITHGGQFVVVDRKGRIRAFHDSSEPGETSAALRDAEALLGERD